MPFTIKAFGGQRPIVDPLLLEATEATQAMNTRLLSGALTPLRGTTTLKALTKSSPQTIWRYGTSATETDYWLEFLADTDVMASPIAADPYGRVYWADGAAPKYGPSSIVLSGASYPGNSYNLGVPAPASAPVVTASVAPPDASQSEARTYVYTFVTAYGEEGPPSSASAVVTVDPSSTTTISLPSTSAGGSYNLGTKRIYRSSTVGTSAQFQFVAEVAVATTSYADSVLQAELGEVLPSTDWVAPPSGMKGLKLLANGAAIGFKDNTAYLSEPNLPHAWPHQYPVEETIVGIGVFRQSAVLLTNGRPYLLNGVDPSAMSAERMELPQACLSKRSIVDTGDGVIYASPDGLVAIGSGGINVLTKNLFTREQWQAYNPASMVAAVYENRYHAAYQTTAGARGWLTFDFSGQGATFTQSDINTSSAVTALYADIRSDTLYMAQGSNIVRFDAGSNLTYTWRSKLQRMPFPLNMGRAQVLAAGYPVTFKLYADGALKHTQTVAGADVFKLPSGYRALDYQIELTGSADVTQVSIAAVTEELRQS